MEQLRLQSSWSDVKEKIKEHNVNLTDDDLAYQPGRENELLERLARKLKRPKEEIQKWIESVSSNSGKAG
jgi:hypothetical protein